MNNDQLDSLAISVRQTPGVVSFENYETIRTQLAEYVRQFGAAEYSADRLYEAEEDLAQLKKLRKLVKDKKKEIEDAYSAPFAEVEKKLDEIIKIIEEPYKRAETFVADAEKANKRAEILAYSAAKASELGEIGAKIIANPKFFNTRWLNKTFKAKDYQSEINTILTNAASDIESIMTTGGDNADFMLAHYIETLSMDSVKKFTASVKENVGETDVSAVVSENNVLGWKILKITATEDQMASLLDRLELLGVEYEELEDGMPKPMTELREPDFDSFVAFDIETSGSYGVEKGDGEPKITEIGAVRVVNGEVVERFDELCNPGREIIPYVARMTHITNEMVADKPPVDEVIRRFREFVGESVLVGHNIKSCDLRYIKKAADRAGVSFDGAFLDTLLLAKKFKEQQGWENIQLGYLAGFYGFEHKEAHRAWSDAEVNAQVFFELKKLSEKD